MNEERFNKKMRFWTWLMTVVVTLFMVAYTIWLVCECFDWNPITWVKNFKLKASEALKKRAEDKKAAHEAKKKTKKGYTKIEL